MHLVSGVVGVMIGFLAFARAVWPPSCARLIWITVVGLLSCVFIYLIIKQWNQAKAEDEEGAAKWDGLYALIESQKSEREKFIEIREIVRANVVGRAASRVMASSHAQTPTIKKPLG